MLECESDWLMKQSSKFMFVSVHVVTGDAQGISRRWQTDARKGASLTRALPLVSTVKGKKRLSTQHKLFLE